MDNIDTKQREFIEKICKDTWKEIYRFIYYKVQNREEAEDITQETYAKALSYLNKSDIKVLNYTGYLKAISMNIIRDNWRAKKRKGNLINIEDVNPELMSEADFSDMVDDRTIIENALRQLPKEQQTVLILRIIKGCSSAEAARVMNKKEGTVRVLQYRALKALSELLQKQQGRN